MTTDRTVLGEQICWSNLAKKCHDRDVRRIQHSVRGDEGVQTGRPVVGKTNSEAKIKAEETKRSEVEDKSAVVASRSEDEDLPSVYQDREDTELPTRPPRPKSKKSSSAGDSILKVTTCRGSDEKYTLAERPKGSRKDLSGMARELLELRLHMIKEEKRFRLQEQNFVNREVQGDETPSGVSRSEGRTKPEKLKDHEEHRRKQRSPLRNQTNIVIDDLKGKVNALLKQRKQMREHDRLLRLQLDEIRSQWEDSVQQEKAKVLYRLSRADTPQTSPFHGS